MMRIISKYVSFCSLGVLILLFICATVVEKFSGTAFVIEFIYTSPLIVSLWFLLSLSSVVYLVLSGVYKRVITFLIHISFIIILIGALFTHCYGINGFVHIREDVPPTTVYMLKTGNYGRFPFQLSLKEFTVINYENTDIAKDYVSEIVISDTDGIAEATVSMNNIYIYKGWRFCLSQFDDDRQGCTLLVSHDILGTGITYTGYFMLFFSFVAFFFQKRSLFFSVLREVLSKSRGVKILFTMFFLFIPDFSMAQTEFVHTTASLDTSSAIYLLYERICNVQPLAVTCVLFGIILFIVYYAKLISKRFLHYVNVFENLLLVVATVYILSLMLLRGYIGGYMPFSNGFETMLSMALFALLAGVVIRRRFLFASSFALLVAGFALFVAGMGDATQITPLMPVLQSPLLSVHVAVIMLSYSLFAFAMLNGVAALLLYISRKEWAQIEYMAAVTRLILYPALFLLVTGVFIGAMWANISWGRYWGWDPKEVWALITILIYSFPLHSQSLSCFRSPVFLHVFSVLSFLAVLVTYFGVNYILGGLHGYI